MLGTLSQGEEAQLLQTIEMFEVITQSQPQDYQSLEILKEAYLKLGKSKEVIETSKRIASAYVQLGQLSSAILEYETILQRYPDDKDALAAMAEIESKANSLSFPAAPVETESIKKEDTALNRKIADKTLSAADIDDGRAAMQKIFVDGKFISINDFQAHWFTPDPLEAPGRIIDPFLQILADKAIQPWEKSLRILADKTRLGYLQLDKYDLDVEMSRTFPKEICQRWCILPFDKMSKSLMVATTNPFNKRAAEELQKAANMRLLWYLASPPELVKVIKKVFR